MSRTYPRSFRAEGQRGAPIAGAQVTLWTAATGGTQITTGITDLDGGALGSVLTCDAWGYLPPFIDTLDRADIYAIGSTTGAISGVSRVHLESDVSTAGSTMVAPLIISPFDGVAVDTLPLGRPGSALPALGIIGSPSGGEDETGGSDTDTTARIDIWTWQRAEETSYGEQLRIFLMQAQAKGILAWYKPRSGYDGSGDPVGTLWEPIAWIVGHAASNDDPTNFHNHLSIEIPDSDGLVQTRLEFPFGPQGTGIDQTVRGIDHTNIKTNLADLTIRAAGSTAYPGGRVAVLRIAGGNHEKIIEFGRDADSAHPTATRWRIVVNTDAESTGDAGSNFVVRRHNDAGTQSGTSIFIRRSNGNIALGQASAEAARVAAIWGTSGDSGFLAKPSSTPGAGAAFAGIMTVGTDRLLDGRVTGDTVGRMVVFSDGLHEWGPGNAGRDTNLYRSAADTLKTDDTLHVATDLHLVTAGSGIRVKEGSNATMGVATLVAGTVVVSTTKVTANSRIFLTGQDASGTAGFLTVSARTAATSFTILSSSATDTRSVAWWIVEPA